MTMEGSGGRFSNQPVGGAASLRFLRSLLCVPLIPLSLLYGALGSFRAGLYARGRLATHRLSTPVISVGNLTVGGSGKTPMVEYLARLARQAGLRPAVLTRGYRRGSRSQLIRACTDSPAPGDPRLLGDEPFMLYTRNPGLPVYIGKDRAAAGRLAELLDAPDVMVLDDGFQHLRLARQLNVLLIDGAHGLGNRRVLPCGPL
ncbi:MAG: tetraacyldisaccharide 4'-kinase, partial [SAR324 cluster bacterium]|nr:tetraacyldisaccharide 4'-kinase [SAR324 cluster bacterium]